MLLARLEILDQLVRLVLLVLTLQFLALQAQLALRERLVLKVILDLSVLQVRQAHKVFKELQVLLDLLVLQVLQV